MDRLKKRLSSLTSKCELVATNISTLNIRFGWLIVLAFLLPRVRFVTTPSLGSMVETKKAILILSYLLLLAALSQNLRLWGLRLMTLGVGLNFAAIVANGGFMPVSAEARLRAGSASTIAAFRLLPRVQTELWFLTDLIPVPWLHMVVSAGDVFIALGLFVLVAEAIKGKRLASINCSEPEGCESDSNIVP